MKKPLGKMFAVISAVCLSIGALVVLLGTISGILRTFVAMQETGTAGTPERMADNIGVMLLSTTIGALIGLAGLIMLPIALFKFKYRAKWFFWFLCVFSLLWLLNFPIGTILGISLLAYLLIHKREFDISSHKHALTR